MTQFTFDLALSLVQSSNEFPINFEDAWQWLEFSSKSNAKRNFEKANFIENIDFVCLLLTDESDNHSNLSPQEKAVLQRTQHLGLTVDCFKMWSMMVNTEKGKLVRLYFLECEKQLKEKPKEEYTLPTNFIEALKALVTSEEEKQVLKEDLKNADETITGYRNMFNIESTLNMKQASDAINLPKLGRNNLIKYLKDKRLLTKSTGAIPTRYALERGYMLVETSDWTSSQTGVTHTHQAAMLTFKGFCWLVKQLNTDGYNIKQTPQAMWDVYFPSNVFTLKVVN